MAGTIEMDAFRSGLQTIFEELFETEREYLLDKGEHFWATLDSIDADLASRQAAPGVSTIAAQVTHVEFLIDGLVNHFGEQLDWGAAWQVNSVTADEWQALIAKLKDRYTEMRAFAAANEHWDAMMIGGAFALVAHIAYHLGQIREKAGILRANA